MTYNQVESSAKYIMSKTRIKPKTAVVLGTGLNPISSDIENATRIPYKDIPRWNKTVNKIHEGTLIIGMLDDIPVAVMSGRLHYYEGNSFAECAYPIAVLRAMGVEKFIFTNAAGGINPEYKDGEFVLISDHIKFFDDSPLRGEDATMLGTDRFFDMSDTYNERLRNCLISAYEKITGTKLKTGVYAFMPGPQFETPAELRMLHIIGADLVGMSTVPEAIMAAACGLKVLGISVVSDMATGTVAVPVSTEDINEVCAGIKDDFKTLIRTAVKVFEEDK